MFNQETSEEAAAELLHSYQQTLNNLAQKMLIKDVRIDNFHGRDNEDISRWFDMHEIFSGLHLTEEEKVTYFIEDYYRQ